MKVVSKISFFSAITAAFGSLVFIIGISQEPDLNTLFSNPLLNYGSIVDTFRKVKIPMLLYGWGGVVASISSIVFFIFLDKKNRSSIFILHRTIGIIGSLLCLIGFLNVGLSSIYYVFTYVKYLDKEVLPIFLTGYFAAIQTQQAMWVFGSFLGFCLCPLLISIYALMKSRSNIPNSIFGFLCFIFGLYWLGHFVYIEIPIIFAVLNVISFSLWSIIAGKNLVSDSRKISHKENTA
jgi:hypothetical protein